MTNPFHGLAPAHPWLLFWALVLLGWAGMALAYMLIESIRDRRHAWSKRKYGGSTPRRNRFG